MRPHVKLYVSSPLVDGVFGDGKWRLLTAVGQLGSIQAAAGALGRSYRKAWGDIERAQEGLGWALVRKQRGGRDGGKTGLTPECMALLAAWQRHRETVRACVEESYRQNLQPFFEQRAETEDLYAARDGTPR